MRNYNSIYAAHTEAEGARNGIGLVKLMGRESGFIAANACLANSSVNFCLIPMYRSRQPFPNESRLIPTDGFGIAYWSPPGSRGKWYESCKNGFLAHNGLKNIPRD